MLLTERIGRRLLTRRTLGWQWHGGCKLFPGAAGGRQLAGSGRWTGPDGSDWWWSVWAAWAARWSPACSPRGPTWCIRSGACPKPGAPRGRPLRRHCASRRPSRDWPTSSWAPSSFMRTMATAPRFAPGWSRVRCSTSCARNCARSAPCRARGRRLPAGTWPTPSPKTCAAS